MRVFLTTMGASGLVFIAILCVTAQTTASNRRQRFFPILGFGYGPPRGDSSPCTAQNLMGTCSGRRDCSQIGGVSAGDCARGLGVCCVVLKSCGSSSNVNTTYFTNPGFPSSHAGGGRCSISISKAKGVNQFRLDFLELILAQPDANGFCQSDFISVTGGSFPVPRICGSNGGSHVYVDIPQGTPSIIISIDTDVTVRFARSWNIKVTQIEKDNPSRAPSGCLQYYQEATGQISSFNYGTTPNQNNDQTPYGTREMANLDYAVCVRPGAGYCSIVWSQLSDDPYSFTVSDNTAALAEDVLGSADAALTGSACDGDYISIPQPMQNQINVLGDRFCGNAILPTTSCVRPFQLTVVTNNTEVAQPPQTTDVGNRGFRLNYRQLPCPIH